MSSGKLILSGVMPRKINRSLALIGGGGRPCLNKSSFTVEINFKLNFKNIVILNPGLLKVSKSRRVAQYITEYSIDGQMNKKRT